MHLRLFSIFTFLTLLLPSLVPQTLACAPPHNASSPFQIGHDGHADPETLGYSLNHFALLVNDIEASTHFYSKILGMRHVFTFHGSPTYQIVYLSYSQGGSNGTGFQTGKALFDQKTNTQGQLELIYRKGCDNATNTPATTQRVSTLSHVGLIVPDVKRVQERMEKFNVPILKRPGEDFRPKDELQGARVFGFGDDVVQARMTARSLGAIGLEAFLVVVDPDRNAVEIQPEVV